MSCRETQRVDRHFEERLAPEEEHAMREHLSACDACRARYERHLLLERLDPQAKGAGPRLAHGLGLGGPRPSVVRTLAGPKGAVPLALAVAASVAFLVHGLPRRDADPTGSGRATESEFASRGGAPAAAADAPEVTVYRRSAGASDGGAVRAGASIRRDDELAFAYRNPEGKRYLMIYGVDERQRVYWYYPVWTDPTANPTSIEIEPAASSRPLPDAVRHRLEGRELDIHAVFTDAPLDVRAVEAAIASGAPSPGGPSRTRFHVEP